MKRTCVRGITTDMAGVYCIMCAKGQLAVTLVLSRVTCIHYTGCEYLMQIKILYTNSSSVEAALR